MAVDIVAATVGDLGIDIKAQTLENLDIDIQAQTLSELTQRWKYGACRNAQFLKTLIAGTETTIFSLTGKGYFIYLYFYADYDDIPIYLKFDGPTTYWGHSAATLDDAGYGNATPFWGVLKRVAGSEGALYISPPMPMSFESSFEITALNTDTADHTAVGGIFYAIL
ncbi:MAG: hypothetical protein ACXQTR_04555, partial [Candidatus Methanospirareceae archaeon]